ncbi:MAG TPA: BatA domain-containing protein [Candidatus Kapabacteria bacterium]|jgi:hypothetical protein|nr:BatA domain-containing protein [Candidatus Kapabacteria bacterium]
MTFLNPLFLFGLAASALPVLFHLFARRKARRVEFSSLRFLQKLEKTSMRAVKIRQILLLIVRTLLVIAIVLAFARPALRGYLGSFFGSSHANTSMVFLLDNSASMSRSDERGELLKQSKDAALSIAQMLEDGDDATVVPLASIVRGKQYNPIHTKQEVIAAINDVYIADRPAELSSGLRMASALLASSNNVNKEVYLFSDAQARNLREESEIADTTHASKTDSTTSTKLFDASTRFFTMTVGHGEHINGRNLSLDSLKPITTVFEPGRPIQFEAWVRNTTQEAAQNIAISLYYNGDRVAQKTIPSVAGGNTESVEIDGPIRGSGIISVRAELEQDALPFDNTRFTVINVPVSRRIAIFLQDPSNATFINLALSQTLTETQGGMPFTTEIRRMEDLRSLSATGTHYDAIMAGLGPTQLAPEDRSGLKDYIAAGNGASIFLMTGLDVTSANSDLTALGLPQITRKEGAPNETEHYLSFAQFDFQHPFFAGMFEAVSTSGNALRGIESPKIFESYDLATNVGLPLIKLSNGSPFLTEVKIGKGDVMLYAIPPTLQFSDFPRKSIFLPLIRRTAAYTSAVRSQQDENVAQQFVTTEPFEVELPEGSGIQPGTTVLVKSPDGSSQRAPVTQSIADGKLHIHLEEAHVAGNYTVYRDAEARDLVAAFAVNIQSDESDLRASAPKEVNDYLAARMSAQRPSIIPLDPSQRDLVKTIDQSRYGVELWQAFLWAALILAVIEMLLAREAKRVIAAPAI